MCCQNYDDFKAERAKGIHYLQVNKYYWILLLILCLAVLGPCQGPLVTLRPFPFLGNEQLDVAHPNTAMPRTFHGNAMTSPEVQLRTL